MRSAAKHARQCVCMRGRYEILERDLRALLQPARCLLRYWKRRDDGLRFCDGISNREARFDGYHGSAH